MKIHELGTSKDSKTILEEIKPQGESILHIFDGDRYTQVGANGACGPQSRDQNKMLEIAAAEIDRLMQKNAGEQFRRNKRSGDSAVKTAENQLKNLVEACSPLDIPLMSDALRKLANRAKSYGLNVEIKERAMRSETRGENGRPGTQ